MSVNRDYLYYVYGYGSRWTALCVDLDISVQADSMRGAMDLMNKVGSSYIEDAMKESPEVRDRLLNRSSPWHIRLSLWLQYQLFLFRRRRPHHKTVSSLALPCPA